MIMYLLDKQQNIIKAISDGIIEAKMTEEINTADKLSFSLVQNQRLTSNIYFVCIPATRGDAFLMFKIISESVKDDRIEYTCIESAYDELKSYAYIKDLRPQDKTASEMLQLALAGTRWEVGYSEETTRKRTNFYYISTLEAIQKIVELFKVELTFSIIIDPLTNRITRRQVNLYNQQGERTGKRFEYGSNLLSVTREESSEDLVTALVGRGKGEQLDDGNDDTPDGYGRRIMFTDVVWSKANGNPTDKPAGQDYVEDKEATKLYGFDDGKPRIGIAVFEDIEDVTQLINATWSALQVAKRPKVSFKASALDVGDLGLGDTVAIIRHELGIEYFTRVYKVEHDLLDKNNNVIELGDDFSERSLTSYVSSIKAAQEETTQVANVALTSANGKNKNFYSTTKPAVAAEGDNLFLDLGNGETEHYVWHAGSWELITSTAELDTVKRQVESNQRGVDEALAAADQIIDVTNQAYGKIIKDLDEVKKNAVDVDGLKINVKEALDAANNVSKNYVSLREELLTSDKNNYDALMAEVNKTKQPISDLKTDLEGVNGKYASLDGRVGQFSAGLNGLTAQFNTSKEQLAQLKLDAQGLQAGLSDTNGNLTKLQAKANSIEQQMLGKVGNDLFESFKSSTAKELKEKLTATDLNGYVKTTELIKTADGIKASVNAVDGRLNNLSSPNLVYNSEFINNAEGWSNVGTSNDPIHLANNEFDRWKGSDGLAFRNQVKDKVQSASSQFITLSLDSGNKLSGSVQLHVTDTITNGGCSAEMSIIFSMFPPDSGVYNRLRSPSEYDTLKVTGLRNGQKALLYFDNMQIPNGAKYVCMELRTTGVGNVIFNQPMLAYGEYHLPYSTDNNMIGALNDKYAALNITVDGIKSVVADKADKTYVDQRANQINSVVAGKADISLVNQKADQWQLALTNLQTGGTNLVPLTNQGTRDLYVENKFGVASYAEKNIYGVRGILVKNTSPAPANGWFVIGKNVDLSKFKPDTDYVISFNLRGDTSIKAHAIVDVRGANAQNSISMSNPGYDLDLKAGKVLRVEKKFHTLANFTDVGQVLYINCIELSRVKNLEVWDFKIEEGNKATPWAPAPEDSTVAVTAVKNELSQAINLRVQKGDVLSQLNIEAGRTLIQSRKLYLDAESVVFSGKAFIPSAAITDLTADKIRTGTLDAGNVNVINLNANNITSGNIDGRHVGVIGQSASMILNGDDGIRFRGNDGSWETRFGRNSISFMNSVNGNNEYVGNISYVHNTSSPNINGFGVYVTSKQLLGAPYGGDEFSIGYARSKTNYQADMVYNATDQGKPHAFHWYAPHYLNGNARIIRVEGARDPLLLTPYKFGDSTQNGYFQPTIRLGYNDQTKGNSGISFLWDSVKLFGTVDMNGTRIRIDGAEDVLQFSWVSWSDWGNGHIPCIRRGGQGGIGFPGSGNLVFFGSFGRKQVTDL